MKNLNYSEPTNQEIRDFINHTSKVFDDLNDINFDRNGWNTFMYYKHNNNQVIYQFCSSKYLNRSDCFIDIGVLRIIKIEDLMPYLKKYLLLT